eukprot:16445449-Heterocapsa_arctica.AAC.1
MGHENPQKQTTGNQQHREPDIESNVRNEINKIENNIANKTRSKDEQGADRQAKLATHIEVNSYQTINDNRHIAEENNNMANILDMLGIQNLKNGEKMLKYKSKVGKANKTHVQRTILKSGNGSEATLPGLKRQGLPHGR